MNKQGLGEYDKLQLEKAKELVTKVYEYHYGDSKMRSEIKRLETVISKIESILKISEKEGI